MKKRFLGKLKTNMRILNTGKYVIDADIRRFVEKLMDKPRKNKVKGGVGDNLTIRRLIRENPDVDIIQEIILGIKIELEHTDNLYIAFDITMDHLAEIPDYNTRLLKMEKEAEKYWEAKKK